MIRFIERFLCTSRILSSCRPTHLACLSDHATSHFPLSTSTPPAFRFQLPVLLLRLSLRILLACSPFALHGFALHAPTPGKGRALAQITLLQKAVGRCWSHSIVSRIGCRNAKCRPPSSILAHAVVQLVSLTSSLGFDYLELRHTPATPHHAVTF